MRRQERDFFVYLAPFLTGEEREKFGHVSRIRIADALGPALCGDLVHKIHSSPKYRRELLGEMRRAAWWIRNARWTERPAPVAEQALFWEGLGLLGAAGAQAEDLLALAHCSMAACVCDGCDVYDLRFDTLQVPPLVFGSLWRDSLSA